MKRLQDMYMSELAGYFFINAAGKHCYAICESKYGGRRRKRGHGTGLIFLEPCMTSGLIPRVHTPDVVKGEITAVADSAGGRLQPGTPCAWGYTKEVYTPTEYKLAFPDNFEVFNVWYNNARRRLFGRYFLCKDIPMRKHLPSYYGAGDGLA